MCRFSFQKPVLLFFKNKFCFSTEPVFVCRQTGCAAEEEEPGYGGEQARAEGDHLQLRRQRQPQTQGKGGYRIKRFSIKYFDLHVK